MDTPNLLLANLGHAVVQQASRETRLGNHVLHRFRALAALSENCNTYLQWRLADESSRATRSGTMALALELITPNQAANPGKCGKAMPNLDIASSASFYKPRDPIKNS